jgi:hypothetical protein
MALILQPKYRTNYLKKYWPKKDAEEALYFTTKCWERYRDLTGPDLESYDPSFTIQNHQNQTEKKKKKKKESDLERIRQERDKSLGLDSEEPYDEFADYCSDKAYDPKIPALEWWLEDNQKKRWPRLSHFAITVLCIPAMSAEPERIFSGGRRTMRWDRESMSVTLLEMLECQKSWKKQSFPLSCR